VSTYRLVNVPVNPAGRFGAPETEPGPSGVDGEVMTIPFHAWYRLTIVLRARVAPVGIPGHLAAVRGTEQTRPQGGARVRRRFHASNDR
jgi:hypothetical protein